RVMSMARERPNLLVTRTFSKAHGLCGLRVGYGVGGASWVGALDRVRQPFNTNALGQAAALESLRHPAALDRRVRQTVAERERMQAALAETGWPFTPSRANFILVTPDSDPVAGSSGVHEQLLRLGVIVRDGASLGCPGRLRVSVGTPEENAAFLDARARLAPSPRETREGRTAP
ncbi:MAG: aminotransferase class I/II-fold pyridoxal phosphate-dependent enzyme, partial [Thermoleophilia bacterium]|nr:aminotransferase class I/II-fold pyridoxal phosphate-dependent enzyme [Thermoleophilia bacterium]